MKLVRFLKENGAGWGIVQGDMLADVTQGVGQSRGSIHEHLADGCKRLAEIAQEAESRLPLRNLDFAPFLPDSGKIICVGVNYPDRNEEYRDGSEAPAYPSLFIRVHRSFAGHEQPVLRPRESRQFDYEGEIAVVIGKMGRRIPVARALEHIAGVTLVNDGTVRDWVRHAKFNVTQGKNFDLSGSIGPWMVTIAEIEDLNRLTVETRVNGELRQSGVAGQMIFSISTLVAYVSSFTTLEVGDIISTGTPPGAGARLDPPRWLKKDDVVEVSCPEIGILRNKVIDD